MNQIQKKKSKVARLLFSEDTRQLFSISMSRRLSECKHHGEPGCGYSKHVYNPYACLLGISVEHTHRPFPQQETEILWSMNKSQTGLCIFIESTSLLSHAVSQTHPPGGCAPPLLRKGGQDIWSCTSLSLRWMPCTSFKPTPSHRLSAHTHI